MFTAETAMMYCVVFLFLATVTGQYVSIVYGHLPIDSIYDLPKTKSKCFLSKGRGYMDN